MHYHLINISLNMSHFIKFSTGDQLIYWHISRISFLDRAASALPLLVRTLPCLLMCSARPKSDNLYDPPSDISGFYIMTYFVWI